MNFPQRPARRANALPDVRPVKDCTLLQSISAEPPVPRLSTSSIPRLRTSGPKIPRYSTRVPVEGYPGPPSTATIGGPVGDFGARYQRNAMSIRRPVGFAGSSGRESFPQYALPARAQRERPDLQRVRPRRPRRTPRTRPPRAVRVSFAQIVTKLVQSGVDP